MDEWFKLFNPLLKHFAQQNIPVEKKMEKNYNMHDNYVDIKYNAAGLIR